MNSKSISKIFHRFSNNKIIRIFFGKLYHKILLDPIRNKEIKKFQNNSKEIIKEFDQILKELKIPYCLMWGSLIGAVREKGFIKHDFDIDIGIWIEDYKDELLNVLKQRGFIHKDRLLVDNGISAMEDTVEKNNVAIDIFYLYKDSEGKAYTCVFDYMDGCITWEDCLKKYDNAKLYKYYLNFPSKFIYVPFEDFYLPIPHNFHEILTETYGINYMIPDKNWSRDPDIKRKALWKDKKVKIII